MKSAFPKGEERGEMPELNLGHNETKTVHHTFATEMFPIDGSRTRPPFIVSVEKKCEVCGGSGYDWGSLRPMEPDVCSTCDGTGIQIVVRNYLSLPRHSDRCGDELTTCPARALGRRNPTLSRSCRCADSHNRC